MSLVSGVMKTDVSAFDRIYGINNPKYIAELFGLNYKEMQSKAFYLIKKWHKAEKCIDDALYDLYKYRTWAVTVLCETDLEFIERSHLFATLAVAEELVHHIHKISVIYYEDIPLSSVIEKIHSLSDKDRKYDDYTEIKESTKSLYFKISKIKINKEDWSSAKREELFSIESIKKWLLSSQESVTKTLQNVEENFLKPHPYIRYSDKMKEIMKLVFETYFMKNCRESFHLNEKLKSYKKGDYIKTAPPVWLRLY